MPPLVSPWVASMGGGMALSLVFAPPAVAQTPCPYAIVRIESQQAVDQAAVCEAAKPWADAGYAVLVFLTDARPSSEDAWFTLLDGVEAEAGLRDLSQTDSFRRAAIALEATTATDLPYAVSITYREALYNTPLDTNPAGIDRIKASIREKIAGQDATWALTTGLTDLADLAGVVNAPAPMPPSGEASPSLSADSGVNNALAGGGLVMVGGGTVGFLALRRRRIRRLNAHLITLQSRVANLLMGCEQLLAGNEPESTVPYLLFAEADGDRYPQLAAQVNAWLTEARQALDQAFQAHAHLQEDGDQLKRPLPERIAAWEMLYLSFVGNRDRIRAMSDEELQTLLNPALVLGKTHRLSRGLVTQLETIQRQMQDAPLKVELLKVDPQTVDVEGILGLVEQVDNAIDRLRRAVTEAPQRLAAVQQQRQALTLHLPDSLELAPAEALAALDAQIAEVEATLTRDRRYLDVLTQCDALAQHMGVLETLIKRFRTIDQQRAEIQAIQQAGYRPPTLPQRLTTVAQILERLRYLLRSGHYGQVPDTLLTLVDASSQAHAAAQDWQAQHQHNQNVLKAMGLERDRLQTLAEGEATAAWDWLQAYPPSNWQDLSAALPQATDLLNQIRNTDLPHLIAQNDLSVQAFEAVRDGTDQTKQRIAQAEHYLQTLLDRQRLVHAAEVDLNRDLAEVATALAETTKLVTPKLLGLLAVGKPDPRLQQVQIELDTAHALEQGREYLLACEACDRARRIVISVYGSKVRETIPTVQAVVRDADAHGKGQAELQQALALIPTEPAIAHATGSALTGLYQDVIQARALLEAAEARAQAEIRRTVAARKR
ncbi:MAG: hypothetical protein IGR92_11490 [Leptolyngbyaceae cyanobacterium T60_A2020_046]|nr:hypothetical protein [Leptolyngbyaceae cyanobacterium T60_A2020_046]